MKKFLRCEVCGNLVGVIEDSGVPMMCCGKPMTALEANTTDAAGEKHVPVVEQDGDKLKVKVGEVAHPMTPEHLIEWIYVEFEDGGYRAVLTPEDAPEAEFCINGKKPLAVYEYCNLHGLWKAEL